MPIEKKDKRWINIHQTGIGNIQTYQVEVVIFIWLIITNSVQGNVYQLKERITNQSLEFRGLLTVSYFMAKERLNAVNVFNPSCCSM